jgi:SAM-dependent methyltransferase
VNPSPPSESVAPRPGSLFLATFTKLASVQPGERVLDLHALDGAAALEAARRSGPSGEQIALDTDEARVASLLERARADGIETLQGGVSDATQLPGPDSYWDVVLCHLALPHLVDPEATIREVLRVLRPVGRVAFSTWGQRERCPLVTIFLEAVAPHNASARTFDRALFRYAEVGLLARTLGEIGFEDAVPDRSTEWPFFADVDEYWSAMAGDPRFAPLTAHLTDEQIAAAKEQITAKTKFYRRRGGMELKCEGIVLAAVK